MVATSLGLVRVIAAVIVPVTEQVAGHTVTVVALELLRCALEARLSGTVRLVRAVMAVFLAITEPVVQQAQAITAGSPALITSSGWTGGLITAVRAVEVTVAEPGGRDTYPVTTEELGRAV